MIQEIHSNFDKTFKNCVPTENDYVFMFKGRDFLGKVENSKTEIPTYQNLEKKGKYLFAIDTIRYFLWLDDPLELEGYSYISVRSGYHTQNPKEVSFALMSAYHVYTWNLNNQYCGRCGKSTRFDDKEFARVCDCGNIIYPRINPAVNIGIMNGDKIVMAKHNRTPYIPYALISGFVEYGESLEDTIHREVMEEVGLKVKNIQYYGSQPWGISGNLQVGFFCELDGDDTLTIDTEELADARWFSKEEMPDEIGSISITGTMIHNFKYSK